MSLNMKALTQALAKASAVIEKTVQTTVQEVTGPKPLLDYELLDQIGSAGPGLAWKLYSAKPVRETSRTHQYPTVCVWVLDKKALSDARTRAGLSKAAEDAFLDIIRADGTRLVKLRHPGVVHVVQALDENKNAMAMVTEPLFASVANVLGNVDNVAKVPKDLKGIEMGLLEVKHGLLQLAESLDFLHNNAQLIHRAISPENVFITSNGAWKLGGFGFAISVDQATGDMANVSAFNYAEYDVEDSVLPLHPSLNYTAPELVRSKAPSAGCSSDIFSYGCLVYHLIARKSLFDCHNNVKMYMNTLNYLSNEVFSSIPPELVPNLQRMLSANESLRPTAKDFTGSPFFRNDTRLRALRFLDHMLERDNMQKSEFLKALSDMWKEFDSRVLRYKVLPPLCAELRNLVMQPMILPMVLIIAESQDTNDFELSTLPALVPVLNSAAGETLLLLVKHAELLINKTSQEQLISHVLPMIVRAYSDNDARIQEEVLRKSVLLAKQLDSELVKLAILPRVHGLALKTTVAAVRVNALLCLGDLVYTLNKHAVLDILQTIQRCTEVDRSSPTLMCTLAVANSILKQLGVEFTAEHVLPLVTPLLTAQQLNVQQFAKYMLFVKNILKKIEEKRGVSVTDSGIPEVKASAPANGLPLQASNTASETVASTAKISPAWDEDWDTPARQTSASLQNSTNITTSSPVLQSLPIQTTHLQSLPIPEASHKQKTESCPSVDIEWPPRASFGITTQSGDIEKHLKTEISSTASFDDIDPFANWPPKPSGSASVGSLNKGVTGLQSNKYESKTIWNTSNKMNLQKSNSNSWNFAIQSSDEQLKQHQGNSTSTTGSLGIGGSNPQNSIGILKQSQGIIASSTNLGTIYASSKNEKAAPRLAPPPSTPMGRGRVRGSASSSHPIQVKSPSEQPPLLDLL